MSGINPSLKEVLDVNIVCWRHEYNRNRRWQDKETGYQHLPNKILMNESTWHQLLEDFVGKMYAERDDDAEIIPDPATREYVGPRYLGVPIEFDDSLEYGHYRIV
jgi:hypothetical protein